MSGATIITLGPSNTSSSTSTAPRVAATFEEAFGEFSEARGKGRAKRQARKLDRRKKKTERKVARQTSKQEKIKAKQETKQVRRGGRQEARIARRATRKDARQEMRGSQQEARMGRRTRRQDMKQQRTEGRQLRKDTKALGEEGRENLSVEQSTYRDNMLAENEAYRDELQPQEADSTEEGYADESTSDDGYSEEGYADDGYADDGYADEGADDEYSEDDYAEDEYSEDDYADDGYADDEYSDNEDTGNFDGTVNDDSFNEMNDNATRKIYVNPNLVDICNKIEWNKELIARLEEKRKQGSANPSEISKQIIERKQRVAALQGDVDLYLGFGAEFSSADGMLKPSMESTNPSKKQILKRRTEVQAARKRASVMKSRGMQDKMSIRKRTNNGGDVTPVDVELQPTFEKGKIVVPSSSSFNDSPDDSFDYANGQDNAFDYADGRDLPMRESFAMASDNAFDYADGSDSSHKINWMGVLVGVALGATAIWAIRKYKLLDK
jgi:hypothetical protein